MGKEPRCFVRRCFLIILGLLMPFPLFCSSDAAALDLSFEWDANKDQVDGYRIFCREQGEEYDYSSPCWEGPTTNGTIYNLNEDTAYYFVLRAYNAFGESRNSIELMHPPPSTSSSRSSSGKGGGGGGCFISFVVEGSRLAKWLDRAGFLKYFREEF